MTKLIDHFGRHFTYLRLSLTESCNFRCQYCLPNGCPIDPNAPSDLSLDEITHLLNGFAELGIKKIRLTGGEPSLRKDLTEIIQAISHMDAIESIALTTNGSFSPKRLDEFVNAGLNRLNLSLDSLNRETFHRLTQTNKLDQILAMVNHATNLELDSIKLNAVLLKNYNDHELPLFLDFIKDRPITIRFIELMQTLSLKNDFLKEAQMPAKSMIEDLKNQGWIQKKRSQYAGPAMEFKHPDYRGAMGFITPYGEGFCESCNRLRISSQGKLQLCLFGKEEIDLRPFLKSSHQKEDLKNIILAALTRKEEAHHLHENNPGIRGQLASIGG